MLQRNEMKSVLGGGPYCSGVAADSVASYELENDCLTGEQYNYAFNYAYNICMDYEND